MSIRVLLVDDQELVRTGFRMVLTDEESIEVVGEAGNGREAIAAAERHRPDVIVMDIRMPVMDGIEATRRLATDTGGVAPRILVLTTFDADEHVVDALRAGASGFLLKDVTPADFVAAIRVVAAGDALIAPAVTRRLLDRFARLPMPTDADRDSALGQLTEREIEGKVHEFMLERGCEIIYDIIVASGGNTSPYRRWATDKLIRQNDMVIVDINAVGPSGYFIDFVRCFKCGDFAGQALCCSACSQQLEHPAVAPLEDLGFRTLTHESELANGGRLLFNRHRTVPRRRRK